MVSSRFRLQRGLLSSDEALRFTCDILQGLVHLGTRRVCHGDAKPENTLICNGGRALLADLGCAQEYAEGDVLLSGLGFTRGYAAPELETHQVVHVCKSDVFSTGKVYHFLTAGEPENTALSLAKVAHAGTLSLMVAPEWANRPGPGDALRLLREAGGAPGELNTSSCSTQPGSASLSNLNGSNSCSSRGTSGEALRPVEPKRVLNPPAVIDKTNREPRSSRGSARDSAEKDIKLDPRAPMASWRGSYQNRQRASLLQVKEQSTSAAQIGAPSTSMPEDSPTTTCNEQGCVQLWVKPGKKSLLTENMIPIAHTRGAAFGKPSREGMAPCPRLKVGRKPVMQAAASFESCLSKAVALPQEEVHSAYAGKQCSGLGPGSYHVAPPVFPSESLDAVTSAVLPNEDTGTLK